MLDNIGNRILRVWEATTVVINPSCRKTNRK